MNEFSHMTFEVSLRDARRAQEIMSELRTEYFTQTHTNVWTVYGIDACEWIELEFAEQNIEYDSEAHYAADFYC